MGEERREKKTPPAATSQVAKRRKPGRKPKPGPLLDEAWEEAETSALRRIFGLASQPRLPARIYEPQEAEPTIGPADDYFGATLSECATELGVSKERIRQIELRALSKLRQPPRSTRLLEAWRGSLPPEAPPPDSETETLEEQRRRAPWKYFPKPDQLDQALARARAQVEERRTADPRSAFLPEARIAVARQRKYIHECDACDRSICTDRHLPPSTWLCLGVLHLELRQMYLCRQCQRELRWCVWHWFERRQTDIATERRHGLRPWPIQPHRRFVP